MNRIKLMQGPQDGRVLELEGVEVNLHTPIKIPRTVRSPIKGEPLMRYVDTYCVVSIGKRGTSAANFVTTEEN